MRVLITGATGQVGQALQEVRWPEDTQVQALPRAELDLADPDAAATVVRASGADLVVNAAAYTAVDAAETDEGTAMAVNGVAPGRLSDACREIGAAFIHISTDYVFDGTKVTPYVEDDAVAPLGAYGRTKLAGEQAVTAAAGPDGRYLILRTAWVYSAHGKNFVKTMLRVGAQRDLLTVVSDQHGSPTAAHQIAEAIVAATPGLLAGEARGVFHLTGGGDTTWWGFAEAVFADMVRRTGRRPMVTPITTAEFPTPATRPANSRLYHGRFAEMFGHRPAHWSEALATVLNRLHADPA